jgi:hypothetical protein
VSPRAREKKATHQITTTESGLPGGADPERSREVHPILHLQRTIGNQATQRRFEPTPATHQTAPTPQIVRIPATIQAAPAPKGSPFDGVLLGTNGANQEVRVKRPVGGSQGYDDRLQAIAVARLAQADPAAVIQGKDGKWHALETTAAFAPGRVGTMATGQVPFVEVHGVPSAAGIARAKQRIDSIRTWIAKLDEMEQTYQRNQPMLEAIREKQEEAIPLLTAANRTHASFVLGVPESEIQSVTFSSGRVPGKVNIVGSPGKGSAGAAHGRVGGDGSFKPKAPSAFHIDLPELDDPAGAATALFHEVQHKWDYDLAQFWVQKYEETGAEFVSGIAGRAPFEKWLNVQVKEKRLKKPEVELIIAETFNDSADTEARANVRTFLAALQAGDPNRASKLLVAYARALKPKREGGGGQYASPATGSLVQTALVEELKTAYKAMTEPMKQQYDDAVAAASQEYPSAWITALAVPKRAKK